MFTKTRTDFIAIFAAFLSAFAALGTAWASQYGFDLFPCELCLYQRLPYIGILALSSASLTPFVDSEPRRLAMGVIALLFLTTAAVAGYHIGVEQGWWDSSCAPTGNQSFSIDDIQSALQKPGMPACNDVPFTLFGLSMAAYNMIAGMALSGLAFWATRKTSLWNTP
tara:strand:- start:41 stop:541 length:501 start_codon:yes stop_codon:yes gene_type:complete